MILGVVVTYGDLHICLPKPNRHSDCIYYAHFTLKLENCINGKLSTQGFYTEDGSYLDRKTALKYAKEHNQLINSQASIQLYSEDLW